MPSLIVTCYAVFGHGFGVGGRVEAGNFGWDVIYAKNFKKIKGVDVGKHHIL